MATPTIFIGIGSSGMYVLEHVQRFYYETFKENKPKHVEYLYIETNKDNKPDVTPLPDKIRRVFISLEEMKQMSKDIIDSGAGWVPPLSDLMNSGLGAGGVRPIGRVGLWGRNNKGNNFRNVVESIQLAYRNISKSGNKPVVFITGTLTGGTASGMFIDLAYMVRDIIKDIKELFGLFLIPNKPTDIVANAQYYANTYASLLDIDQFNSTETEYSEKWPTRHTDVPFKEPPFELFQIISQDYIDGSPAISSLSGLYKMAGLFMFLNMIGIKEKRTARLVDSEIGKYGSFALSAIQYPKDQIEEYVAIELSKELLDRWINHKLYIINDSDFQIIEGNIGEQANEKWDSIINDAINSLNTIGGRGGKDLVHELEIKAVNVNKNDITEEPFEYLFSLFSSSVANNFYGMVKGNIQTAVDNIIESIYDFNARILDDTENITFAKIALEQLTKSIKSNIEYWNGLGISKRADQWDNLLSEQCNWMLKNRYKLLLEQDPVLFDRMITTFDLMKMHLLITILEEIIDNIEKKEGAKLKSSTTDTVLPRLKQFDVLFTDIAKVTGKLESENTSLEKRAEEIISDINDETIPLYRVFPSESFEKEYKIGKDIYQQKTKTKTRTRIDISQVGLWKYLTSKGRNFHNELYQDVLSSYRTLVSKYDCIADYNVPQYIEEHPDEALEVAKKGTLGFLSLNKTLTPEHYMPRFIAASSKPAIEKVIDRFESEHNFTDFKKDKNGILEIKGLNNMMVFYDEKLNFKPLENLVYIQDMKEVYEHKPSNFEGTNETWINYRNAYFKKTIK